MAVSGFCRGVARAALGQHEKYQFSHEHDAPLAAQIERYWEDVGFAFPGVVTPWSAVFVSWCVHRAGATKSDFKFAPAHSRFVHWAIQNAQNGGGAFLGRRIDEYEPKLGDIVQNNRNGRRFDFDFARTHAQYESHSAVVVETGQDTAGRYLRTVGGNESDTVSMKELRLSASGRIRQREHSPFIAIVENRM